MNRKSRRRTAHLLWIVVFSLCWGEAASAQEREEPVLSTDSDDTLGAPEGAEAIEPISDDTATPEAVEEPASALEDVSASLPQSEPETQATEPPSDERDDASAAPSVDVIPRIRSAMVEYRTAWRRGVGFLVHDRRTVLLLGSLRDRSRPITVKMAGSDAEVRVEEVEVSALENASFVILHLENDLQGIPLEMSAQRPGVGERVQLAFRYDARHFRRGRVPEALDSAEAVVTSSSSSTLGFGTSWSQVWHGSPLFDLEGRVVGFFGSESFAVRPDRIFAEERLRGGRDIVSGIFGLRLGTEFGGRLEDPFAMDLELGVALWDQLGIVFRLGFALGEEVLVRLPASAAHEAGIVDGDQRTVSFSLEAKYRLLLTRASMPLYLDFVVGLLYNLTILDTQGMALYASEPDCDPFGGACDVIVGQGPGRSTDHGVGPVFGVDLRAGVFTIGYRFVAEALSFDMVDTHRLTFGITYR